MTGCGGSVPPIQKTPPQGKTQVTILLSTTANDQLSEYELNFLALNLTNQAGTTVSLLPAPNTTGVNTIGPYTAEFAHLNGSTATLITASVPDDTYTSATLTVGGADFTCIAVNSQDHSLNTSVFAYGSTPQSQTTVALPQPIVVAGSAMSLSMQLAMSKSYMLDQCIGGSTLDAYTITPTFNLTVADLASPPTNYLNGRETDVIGQVGTVSGSGFTVKLADNSGTSSPEVAQSVTVTDATAYEGISGLSALQAGTFVDMDLAAQSDGSQMATRVAVPGPAAVDTIEGPLLQVASSVSALFLFGAQEQGTDPAAGAQPLDFSQASFAISGSSKNLGALPFTPSFTAADMVPGQNVFVTTPALSNTGGNPYPLAKTMTLTPQTLDGVVTNVDSSGSFTVYTISLAPYDLFVNLAGQPGTTNLVAQPSQVLVYADSSASLAGVTETVVGSTYLFHGLVFNDNGTLRMDCDEIAAGVTQ